MPPSTQLTGRFFFGFEMHAPWPEVLPSGRLLEERDRHLTLGFLGEVDRSPLIEALSSFPIPTQKVGRAGLFDQALFFPSHNPRVSAWQVSWLDPQDSFTPYFESCQAWMRAQGYPGDLRPFKPHVTMARSPFSITQWKGAFQVLPCYAGSLQLYESLGHSRYEPRWRYPFLAPFEEVSHTADLAYQIRGESFLEIFIHAQLALAFTFPELAPYLEVTGTFGELSEVVVRLNQVVAKADAAIGSPCKAVTYAGEIKREGEILSWEMIVDV